MSTLKPLQIDIVSDVVCPWCSIGKRRIENALALGGRRPGRDSLASVLPPIPGVPREGIGRDEYLISVPLWSKLTRASPDAWLPPPERRGSATGPTWSSASPTPPIAIA